MRGWVDPADAFVTLFASDENCFWLDREHHPSQRFSVLGHAYQNRVISAAELFVELAKRSDWDSDPQDESCGFEFRPGFVGWFDYQADTLRPQSLSGSWLDVREAIVFDHDNRAIFFIGYFATDHAFEEWVRAALLRLSLSGGQRIGYLMRNAPKAAAELISLAHDGTEYLQLIGRVRAHIASGDVYQLCLTNRIDYRHQHNSLEVFLRLREQNPAPYSCYIRAGARALVCSSPEQFLNVTASGEITTRPIKGTRPRSSDPQSDIEFAAELAGDLKERAENLMIVDLMRNDLARVCDPDSVTVTKLFEVEPHASVHQLVSTISGRLSMGVTPETLVSAVFPGGSMTGAPKIRAMQLIQDLEAVPRGLYSGVAGYFGLDGSADLGMVIRSLVFEDGKVSVGVGGGITIDSDPAAEFAETRLKAVALLNALGVQDPWLVA